MWLKEKDVIWKEGWYFRRGRSKDPWKFEAIYVMIDTDECYVPTTSFWEGGTAMMKPKGGWWTYIGLGPAI